MHKATLQVGQELNARAECWREQGEPLQQGQRAPRVPAELQLDFGKPSHLSTRWLLSISQQDCWEEAPEVSLQTEEPGVV